MSPEAQAWRKRLFPAEPEKSPESRVRRQVDGIENFLKIRFRGRILDLGCGGGAQTIELARRKYRILGMDGSSKPLAEARRRAQAENLTVHFMTNDPRRIPYDEEFNAVINVRNPIASTGGTLWAGML